MVATLVWLTSVIVLSVAAVAAHEKPDFRTLLALIYPWLALFVMPAGWVLDKRVNKWWPITGTLCGVYALFITGPAVFLFAPLAVPFAVFLVVFHMRDSARTKKSLPNHQQ